MKKTLVAKAAIQIAKPSSVVFEAIVDPVKMSGYFIETGSGRLETNKTIHWKFPEFDDIFPVTGKVIQANDYISFDWSGGVEEMLVEIFLEQTENNCTIVRIKEGNYDYTEEGIQQAIGQSEGWANFLASLKASLEHRINLRNGAFDFMKNL